MQKLIRLVNKLLTSEIRKEFIKETKDKHFQKVIKDWLLNKPIDDINLAIALSSMLTHSLIDMRTSVDNFTALDVRQQSTCLQLWLSGQYNREEIKEYYRVEWKHYLLNCNNK